MTRLFRLSFILLLVLAFGAVSVASAQTVDATVASPNNTYSVRVPSSWFYQNVDVINFKDSMVIASDEATVQSSIDLLVNGVTPAGFPGTGGLIGVLDTSANTQPLDTLVDPLIQRLSGLLLSMGATVTTDATAAQFGNIYPGKYVQFDFGTLAVMHSDDVLLVAIILTNFPDQNNTLIPEILNSISIPAEGTAPVTPEPSPSEEVSPATPEPQPTGEVTTSAPAASITARSSDMRVSVVIPDTWSLLDNVADQNILAYGDSIDAVQSRLHAAKPDLAPDIAITGNGGLVILYNMAQFGIDPDAPNFSPLMERALAGLTGYTVEQAAAPLEGSNGGLVAVISGAETGYLALIPFGDQFAYVTATSATGDQFEQGEETLLNIVQSVRLPAEPEATPTPTPSGLGGLGGLTEATAEPTIAPTASGLGGLGGLGGEATPEATTES